MNVRVAFVAARRRRQAATSLSFFQTFATCSHPACLSRTVPCPRCATSTALLPGLGTQGEREQSDGMLVALVCLWIGFAIGFLCAAMLSGGHRNPRDEPDDARDELDDARVVAGIRLRR